MSNTDGVNFTLKEEIREYWSDRAEKFDESPSHKIDDTFGMPEWYRLLRKALKLGPQSNLEGKKVLDIACGTGEVSRVMTNFGAEVVAIDFSEKMMDHAKIKLKGKKWSGALADAEALYLLSDATFDFAITRHLVWTLANPRNAFVEWHRVLKPGGKLLIIDGNWKAKKTLIQKVRHWISQQIKKQQKQTPSHVHQYNTILTQLPYGKGLTMEALQTDLTDTGFDDFQLVSVDRLYGAGMRGLPLSDRLKLSAYNRFALLVSKPD